jgi:hypothetical protein
MTRVEVADRHGVALAHRLGLKPPRGGRRDEQQLALAFELDRRRERAPRHVR